MAEVTRTKMAFHVDQVSLFAQKITNLDGGLTTESDGLAVKEQVTREPESGGRQTVQLLFDICVRTVYLLFQLETDEQSC